MRKTVVWASACLVVLLAGCTAPVGSDSLEARGLGEDEALPLVFHWSPPDGASSFTYLLEVSAGPQNECRAETEANGDSYSTDEHLYSYGLNFREHVGNVSIRASISRSDTGIQVQSIKTKPLMDEVREVEDMAFYHSWTSRGGFTAKENRTLGQLHAFHGAVSADEPMIRVECADDNASIKLWEAQTFQSISSNAANSDLALHVNQVELSMNQNGRFSIDTEADLVILDVSQFPPDGSTDMFAEGEFRLSGPFGEETITYQETDEPVRLQRVWNASGSYGLEFDRFARKYSSMHGVFAGFVLTERAGSLEDTD